MSAVTTKTLNPVRVSKQSSNFLQHIALLSSLSSPGERVKLLPSHLTSLG